MQLQSMALHQWTVFQAACLRAFCLQRGCAPLPRPLCLQWTFLSFIKLVQKAKHPPGSFKPCEPAPPNPPAPFALYKPCEPASKNGAPSMDIPASRLSMSILFANLGAAPQHPHSFSLKPCESTSNNGAPSMDIPSSILSRSILFAGAVVTPLRFLPCRLVFKSDVLCPPPPFFCFPKQRVSPVPPAAMRT